MRPWTGYVPVMTDDEISRRLLALEYQSGRSG
jgi:hypothetical protein